MSVIGPYGDVEDMTDIVEEGAVDGTGNDSFSTTSYVQQGRNGNLYNCNASNKVSNSSKIAELKGAYYTY